MCDSSQSDPVCSFAAGDNTDGVTESTDTHIPACNNIYNTNRQTNT